MTLDEESAYDMAEFPSLSLVRVENESLWQLAKQYHSSVEQINRLNDMSLPLSGRILLVPKAN